MTKKKTKKIVVWSILAFFLLIILIMGALVIFADRNTTTHYFYDKSIGYIKTTVEESKWFDIFEQAVRFTPDVASPGDEVEIVDTYTPENNCVGEIKIELDPPAGDYIVVDDRAYAPSWAIGEEISTGLTYTVNSTGFWNARTTYFFATCGDYPSSLPLVPVVESSFNSVEVRSVPTDCDLDEFSSWSDHEAITGGKTQRRIKTSHGTPPDCDTTQTEEFRTVCDTGYHITGRPTDTSAPGITTCEEDGEPPSDCTVSGCTGNQTCNTVTKTCESPECNSPLITLCPDGVNVTEKQCTNSIFVSTGQNCSNHQLATNNTQNNQTVVNNTIINQTRTCWNFVNNTCVSASFTTACPSAQYTSETACRTNIKDGLSTATWFLIGVSGVFLVSVTIFIVLRLTRRR